MTIGPPDRYQYLQSGVSRLGMYVFGKVRDFVL